MSYNAPEYDAHARQTEVKYKLPQGLLVAVKNVGEKSNVGARNPKSKAHGVMQFIPPTARAYGVDTSDPYASIDGAGRYFADLMKRYNGNVKAAVAEYAGGITEARRVMAGEEPKGPITRAYVRRVMQWMHEAGGL